MSRLLNRRQSSIKGMIKPLPVIREPKDDSSVQFRWSTTAVLHGLNDNPSLASFDFDLSSTSSTARNSIISPIIFPHDKLPVHLPPIQTNKKRRIDNNENPSPTNLPLIISYSELSHPCVATKTTHGRHQQFVLNSNYLPSLSPRNEEKYIRLQSSQLRRLHVSNKYIREAKKLYFNAASRVFVPRRPLVEIV